METASHFISRVAETFPIGDAVWESLAIGLLGGVLGVGVVIGAGAVVTMSSEEAVHLAATDFNTGGGDHGRHKLETYPG